MKPLIKYQDKFWEKKKLTEMTQTEWESLCDGCARCCVCKLIDDETEELHFTNVSCRLLDPLNCRCQDYASRTQQVKNCLVLNERNIFVLSGLPESCAYRRIASGLELESWHPLISQCNDSVRQAGISVSGRVVCETTVAEASLQEHIIDWIK